MIVRKKENGYVIMSNLIDYVIDLSGGIISEEETYNFTKVMILTLKDGILFIYLRKTNL